MNLLERRRELLSGKKIFYVKKPGSAEITNATVSKQNAAYIESTQIEIVPNSGYLGIQIDFTNYKLLHITLRIQSNSSSKQDIYGIGSAVVARSSYRSTYFDKRERYVSSSTLITDDIDVSNLSGNLYLNFLPLSTRMYITEISLE